MTAASEMAVVMKAVTDIMTMKNLMTKADHSGGRLNEMTVSRPKNEAGDNGVSMCVLDRILHACL